MRCRWYHDRCQHGYEVTDDEVVFTPAHGDRPAMLTCPSGKASATPNHPVFANGFQKP